MTESRAIEYMQYAEQAVLWGGLLLMLAVESLAPSYVRTMHGRMRHVLANTALWLFSVLLLTLLFGTLLGDLFRLLAEHRIGLLYYLPAPPWLVAIAGFLLLDFSDYIFHRLSHRLRPLWLLHCVHHSDRDVDVSTNLRHHPLELLTTIAWKLVAAAATGAPLLVFMAHELAVITLAQVHHAAVRWPAWIDRWLALLVITPRGHWIHHSPEPCETDANFGVTLALWDRLAGTYVHPFQERQSFGLHALLDARWHSAYGMLVTPFQARRNALL